MFHRLSPLVYSLGLIMAAGLLPAATYADNSGWSRESPASRSWSRQDPGDRSWSRGQHHSHGISHGDHHSYGITGRPEHKQRQHSHNKPQRDRHHKKHNRHYNGPSGGIRGHRSFGYSDPHPRRQYHHHDKNRGLIYRGTGAGVSIYYAPSTYRDYRYERETVTGGTYRPSRSVQRPTVDRGVDPWRALADCQINTARYAFEAQIQQQPHASLPRIGLALSTALSGDLNAGAFAMEDAWLSDTSDVRYFRPDEPLLLVVEELLLSYQGDAMMTASLLYLSGRYDDANRALDVAANYCQSCSSVNSLGRLIDEAR